MRRVPRDLYPDAWRRPLFARRLGRQGPPATPSPSRALKRRSLKYGESVVNRRSLRNRVRCFDKKGRKASIIGDAVGTGHPLAVAYATANFPSNKSKYVRNGAIIEHR